MTRRGPTLTATAALLVALLAGCGGGTAPSDAGSGGGSDDAASTGAEGSGGARVRQDRTAPTAAGAADAGAADGAANGAGAAGVGAAALGVSGRSVVHTVAVTVRVDDLDVAASAAQAAAEQAGGYVESESLGSGDDPGQPQPATLTLRVPADRRGAVLDAVKRLGTVLTRTQDARDVTDERVDVTSRIASAQRSIERLRVLVGTGTSVADVLAVETELARREADLESLQARQAALGAAVDLATVTVTFVRPDDRLTAAADLGFLTGLRRGWEALAIGGAVALTALGAALPFLVLALAGAGGWFAWQSRRRRAVLTTPAAPAA